MLINRMRVLACFTPCRTVPRMVGAFASGTVNPLGIKGLGGIGIVGVNAAVANAVHHATGRRVRTLPIRVEDLLG